jgi:hypothetical protein
MRTFDRLSEREMLALAISAEKDDERTYADYAERLRETFPGSVAVFDAMATEEAGHRRRLIVLYRRRFGDHIPLIQRHEVSGFITRKPAWLIEPLGLETVRKQAATMEIESGVSMKGRQSGPNTRIHGNCWTIWRTRNGIMNTALRSCKKSSLVPMRESRKTRRARVCSYFKSYSLDLQD